MLRHAYQVQLPVFQGPLDLLLHLIERQELDITEVSLAHVTNQFLEYIGQLGERDPVGLADFLVVAAKLILIKSRVLLPKPAAPLVPEEEDLGQDLVQQLVEYRKFKQAAGWLRGIEEQGRHSYVRVGAAAYTDHALDLGDVTLQDLLAAVRQVFQVKPPEPSVNGAVPPLSITVTDQMELIVRETSENREVSFLHLLRQARSRLEVIVTLLAVLEMVKQRRVNMRQDHPFGDILISAREAGEPVAE